MPYLITLLLFFMSFQSWADSRALYEFEAEEINRQRQEMMEFEESDYVPSTPKEEHFPILEISDVQEEIKILDHRASLEGTATSSQE